MLGPVIAPPGAPTEASDDPVPAPEPSAAAFDLLSRAQALADHLRTEVENEVAALRTQDRDAHVEAKRLLADASSMHEDALSAQRSAQARLAEARQEAAQLVSDAADQAALVSEAANLTTESLLVRTQEEADEMRCAAEAESLRLLSLATTELQEAREENAALLSESAVGIESRQSAAAAGLKKLGDEAALHSASIRAAAEQSSKAMIGRATTEADALRDSATSELDTVRAEIAGLRSTAIAEITSVRDAATIEADRVLSEAAAHMSWTQDTVQSLLLTARAEAERLRFVKLERSSSHLASRRRQTQDVVSRVALRVRTALAEASAEAERLRAQANAVLEAAEKDTIATRAHVLAHAGRVIAEADLTAQAALERGQRRLDEAESGSRVVRERAAAEVARLQTEASEHRRAVREEATSTLAAARADADANRAQARDLLKKARAEVRALASRRDDITAQLGHLSGVIEALAVPERTALTAQLAPPPAEGPDPSADQSEPSFSLTTNATTGTR